MYFFIMRRIIYTNNKVVHAEDTFCYRDCVPSVKTTAYVCNRFNTSFRTKDHKKHQAVSFYTLLHQTTSGEGKNSLRKRRDIFASDRQRFFFVTLP